MKSFSPIELLTRGVSKMSFKSKEIRGWEDETYRSVANVMWPNGTSNVYRIGHKGKVDLKYVKSSKGGNYYPEHLPVVDLSNMPLTPPMSNSTSNMSPLTFVLGERVKVSLELELLKAMQEGHGGWNPKMIDVIDRVGCVHRITEKGDVRVIYDNGVKWTFHQAALTKVPLFQAGDSVVVTKNVAHLTEQVSDREEAASIAGLSGVVKTVRPDGTFEVAIRNRRFILHVNCLLPSLTRPGVIPYCPGPGPSGAFGDRAIESPFHFASAGCEEIFTAINKNDLQAVKDLCEENHAIACALQQDFKQPIHFATTLNDSNILSYLLQLDEVNIDSVDIEGNTPLHLAMTNENLEISQMLLQCQSKTCDINRQNSRGKSALMIAASMGSMEKVNLLLAKGCDLNLADGNGETALFSSITHGKSEVALALLHTGSIDYKLKTVKDVTYLHQACSKGNVEIVLKLLELSPDLVNMVDKNSEFSPLYLAVLNNREEIVNILIDSGATVNLASKRRVNPLMIAVASCNLRVISKLVSAGINLSHVDIEYNNCLAHLFQPMPNVVKLTSYEKDEVTEDMEEVAKLLRGICVDSEFSRDALVACYLISKGVKYKGIRNKSNQTPLQICKDEFVVIIIENFIKENASGMSYSSAECRMCNKPANCQFKPCDHVISCEDCVDFFKRCYICKEAVESHKKMTITIQKICVLCDELEANIRFMPCNHNEVCLGCAPRIKKCIKCQSVITGKTDLQGNDASTAAMAAVASTSGASSLFEGAAGAARDTFGASNEELAQLRSKLEQLEDAALCQICIERPKNVVFLCGHIFCQVCASSLQLCPICRQVVSRMIPIYSG